MHRQRRIVCKGDVRLRIKQLTRFTVGPGLDRGVGRGDEAKEKKRVYRVIYIYIYIYTRTAEHPYTAHTHVIKEHLTSNIPIRNPYFTNLISFSVLHPCTSRWLVLHPRYTESAAAAAAASRLYYTTITRWTVDLWRYSYCWVKIYL